MADHDALFKRIFSVPENAAGELQSVLPRELLAHLDLTQLERLDGTFVSDELRFRHTDLLFRAPLGERAAYVYVLIEHQSEPDPDMPFRVLEYMVRIWSKLRADDSSRRTLAPIIPLVVHHGAGGWSAPRTFHDMFEGLADLPALIPFVPSFALLIDDLATATDSQLLARPLAPTPKVAIWLLRDGRDVEVFLDHIAAWSEQLARVVAEHPDESEVLLRYILRITGARSHDEMRRAILQHVPAAEAPLASAAEQLVQQGIAQGVEQGIAQGVEQGIAQGVEQGIAQGVQQGIAQGVEQGQLNTLREMLGRLLTQRFGGLASKQVAAIDGASSEQLERMLLRVITAPDADAVLRID